MAFLDVSDHDGIRTIRLNNGRANTIHQGLIHELRAQVGEARRDSGVSAVMLTGKPDFFSAGLDIVELYGYDAEQFESFWESFMGVIYELTAFPKPMVAAITGHSPAGGCILAMAADYRVMARGKYRIGLNEVPVGIIVPPSVFHLYSFWIGGRRASQYLLEGSLHTVDKALEIGLIDEVADPGQVEAAALAKLQTYLGFHPNAWSRTKENCRKALLRNLEVHHDQHFKAGLDQWWRPEVREMMKGFIAKLGK